MHLHTHARVVPEESQVYLISYVFKEFNENKKSKVNYQKFKFNVQSMFLWFVWLLLILVVTLANMIGDGGVKGVIFLPWSLAIPGMKCQIVTRVHLIIEARINEPDDFGIITLIKTIVFPVSQINPIIQLAGVIAIIPLSSTASLVMILMTPRNEFEP